MLSPAASFELYRAEIFRVDAQEYGAQPIAENFFEKRAGFVILTSKVGGQATEIWKTTVSRNSATKFC